MLQVYPFHGTDVQAVYGNLNRFLAELAIIEVSVPLDSIRANTKYYPDWDRTATTIEVCVDLSGSPAPHEMAEQIRDLHRAAVNGKPEPEQCESADVQAARALIADLDLSLEWSEGEGWMLSRPGCAPDEVAFWGVPENKVLNAVKRHLGLIRPDVPTPTGDDFDPFLDSDDLP